MSVRICYLAARWRHKISEFSSRDVPRVKLLETLGGQSMKLFSQVFEAFVLKYVKC